MNIETDLNQMHVLVWIIRLKEMVTIRDRLFFTGHVFEIFALIAFVTRES